MADIEPQQTVQPFTAEEARVLKEFADSIMAGRRLMKWILVICGALGTIAFTINQTWGWWGGHKP